MPYTELARNRMLDGTYAPPTHVAAFAGNPESGGTEHDRQAVAWADAAGGVKEQSAEPVLEIPGGATVDHLGYFNGADLLFWDEVTPETYGADGTYRVTSSQHDLNLTE